MRPKEIHKNEPQLGYKQTAKGKKKNNAFLKAQKSKKNIINSLPL
jgi:hypothetical protein